MTGCLPSPVSWPGRFTRSAFLAVACLLPAAAAAQNGTVTGTVTDSSTGLPIGGVQVRMYTLNLTQVGSTVSTDASGVYSVTNVPPGAVYFVTATGPIGYIDELYPDVKKPRNSVSTSQLPEAMPIAVAAGATVSGIDFDLDPHGQITGTITNAAGAAVSGVSVSAYIKVGESNATFFSSATTDASGVYLLVGLPTRSYYLHTSNGLGFRNEIFDNVPCLGTCGSTATVTTGTPVAVTAGTTTSGRNFSLDEGGRLNGVVTNAVSGAPAQNVSVQAYTMSGSSTVFGGSANTNAAGEYTISGLASGTYYVLTNAGALTNEIHPNILCPLTCSSTTATSSGTGVNVSLGATSGGINFELDPGGSISGTIVNESTGLPASNVAVVAVVQIGTSTFTRSGFSNTNGEYAITGLPAGAYALYTSSSAFANEIFDNIPCPGFCSSTTAFNTGTLIPVTAGAATANRNFALQPVTAGTATGIMGTVTDAGSGLPIAGVGVEFWRESGTSLSFVSSTMTDVAGAYSISTLTPGTYRADTFGSFGSHTFRNEVFDDIPCLSNFCSFNLVLGGTPITVVSGGLATANFALSRGDGVLGTVTDATTGAPLPNVNVQLYESPSGLSAGSFTTNVDGQFFLRGVPNGTYVAFTSNSLGYRNEIYDSIPCTGSCSVATAVASGTPITVTGAAAFAGGVQLVTGINFALEQRETAPAAPSNLRVVTASATAQFTWSAPSLFSAGVPTSYLLEAGGSPGTTFASLPIPGTGTSYSVPGVPPGAYYVRIKAVNAFGTSPASNEVLLVVGAGGVGLPDAPTNLLAFVSGSLLTMTWSPAFGGGPPSGYIVEAGTATGLANIASVPVAAATFSYAPVPNGVYFLRVRARNAAGASTPSAETMIVVGNVPSPTTAPSFTSHSVSGSTVTLNWSAPARGTPTSYIIEAGSAPGLANLAVANTGSTALTISFNGVPPGTYYVRLRAVNAQGASVVSNERTVIVP